MVNETEERRELTEYLSNKIKLWFEEMLELKKRYGSGIGIIMFEAESKVAVKGLLRKSDKFTVLRYGDKTYCICTLLNVDDEALYSVVKRIEGMNHDIFIHFEIMSENSRTHVKNFTESLFFEEVL